MLTYELTTKSDDQFTTSEKFIPIKIVHTQNEVILYFIKQDEYSKMQKIRQENDSKLKLLTEREHDVMKWLIVGCSSKQICEKLFISSHTLKAHLHNIYEKFNIDEIENCAKRIQAILKYQKLIEITA